jgi:hypothetical protein
MKSKCCKLKKNNFLGSTYPELSNQIKRNPLNNCEIVLKFIVCITGGHCVNSPLASTNLAAPLREEGNITVITARVSVL